MNSPSPISKPLWRRLFSLRLIGVVLFGFVLANTDLSRVGRTIVGIPPIAIVVTFIFCGSILAVKILRWRSLLAFRGFQYPLVDLIHVTSDAIFWGTITPGRLGEFKRIQDLKIRTGVTYGRGVALCVIDRAFDMLTVFFLFVLCAIFAGDVLNKVVPRTSSVVVGFILAFILVSFKHILVWTRNFALGIPALKTRLHTTISEVTDDVLALSWLQLGVMALYSLASWCFYFLAVYVLARSLPFEVTLEFAAVALALTSLVGMIPISIYNLGTRETALILLFSSIGLPKEDALSFSFLFVLCFFAFMVMSFVVSRLTSSKRFAIFA